jgi:hypothetical protein
MSVEASCLHSLYLTMRYLFSFETHLLDIHIIFYSDDYAIDFVYWALIKDVIDISVTMETSCSIDACLVLFDSSFVMHRQSLVSG